MSAAPSSTDRVAKLAALIRDAGSVVALTGAGISVPSGIPDFRSPGTGLWENVDPMEVAHIDAWREDPERFWHFYGNRFQTLEDKEPNGAHHVLVELERRGILDAVVTQNIDRLHRRAGSQRLVEVHGTIDTSSCLSCRARYPIAEVRRRLEDSPISVPGCDCGEPLKPDVVLFGEWLPEGALEEAYALAAGADVLLCIGSSLEVHPIAQLPGITRQNGGEVAIVTQGPTPWDAHAAVKLDGDVVAELEALLAALQRPERAAEMGAAAGACTRAVRGRLRAMGLSVTEVQKALKGADYPASSDDLADLAEENGADEEVIEAIREIDEDDLESPKQVMQALKGRLGEDEDEDVEDEE